MAADWQTVSMSPYIHLRRGSERGEADSLNVFFEFVCAVDMCMYVCVCLCACALYLGLIVFFNSVTCLFMCSVGAACPLRLDGNPIAATQSGKPSAPG